MLLNADGSRTVSLSDLYDETCSSSSWLQQSSHLERQTAARNSRSELCALLSLQSTSESGYRDASTNGTEYQSEASGSQLYRASHNLSAAGAPPQGPYSSRHSSIARQQPTWPLLHVQTAGQQQRRSVTQHLPAAAATAAHPGRHGSMQQQTLQAPDDHCMQPIRSSMQQQQQQAGPSAQQLVQEQARAEASRTSRASKVPSHSKLPQPPSSEPVLRQSTHDCNAHATAALSRAMLAGSSGAAAQGQAAAVEFVPEGSQPAGTAGVTAGAAAATGTAGPSALPSQKDHTERKLVKCLKKLQQDKQRSV